LATCSANAQISFTNQTQLLTPVQHFSGVAIAVLDMNGDGRDDIVRLSQGRQLGVEYQTASNRPFAHRGDLGSMGPGSQWGICAADCDNDGFGDVLAGGYEDGVKIARWNGNGFSIATFNNPVTFTQGVNFADVNNDGWLDAFVCHDDGVSRIFGNNGDGTFTYQPNWIDLTTYPDSDDSGNYGSVWSDVDNDGDLDLYIAKCRQGVNDPTDPRRINQLFLNNGDGSYSQDTANTAGLRIGAQSWTADFGDIDNDGDFDCFITNHDVSSQLLENDGAGHFTDITNASGLFNAVTGLPIQGVFRDFDNDGFVDIVVAGTAQFLFHNNGDKTFTKQAAFLGSNPMESFAIGDLNSDGFQDIYAGYANVYTDPSNIPDALWLNNGTPGNGYFGLNLHGVQSNRQGVGAKVVLHTANGIQVREVRSGESYGISNSLQIHFGLGTLTAIDSVVVNWPSGQRDVVLQPATNQYATLTEGGCLVPEVRLTAPTTLFCTGDSVALTAPAGYSYLWSNGATTATAFATEAATYNVTVTDPAGCSAVSNTVLTEVDPQEFPQVAVEGLNIVCAGSTVTLTSSPASSYLWSNGATTQTIQADASGAYTVTTQGLCAQFTSSPVNITVLPGGAEPTNLQPDTVAIGSAATLYAAGDSLLWYDAPAGGNLLATGDSLVTLPLAENTTFWVENLALYDQPNVFSGMTNHTGTNFSDNSTNGQIIFDAYDAFRLKSFKVYASKEGDRTVQLLSSNGEVLDSKVISVPIGTTVIDVDLDIPVGNDLILTTDAAFNQATLGTLSPQLRRSNQAVYYPYEVPNVLKIKTSNFGPDRYYYFFDWEIDYYARACPGVRVPVEAVVVDTTVSSVRPTLSTDNAVRVYPNPVGDARVLQAELPAVLHTTGVTFVVKNALGATVQSRTLDLSGQGRTQPVTVRLDGAPAGLYWLEWHNQHGQAHAKVVVD
jgi:hypothetical protein